MMNDFNKDRVTLVKKTGEVEKENVPALVVRDMIFTADETLRVEVGDHILRKLPNGLVEDYEVKEPTFFDLDAGTSSHFQIKVVRTGSPAEQMTVVQDIINNFHGSNARVNINSTDNSTNVSTDFSADQIKGFVSQVRPVLAHLPDDVRGLVEAQISVLEGESSKPAPSLLEVRGALQSIKSVAEGASGNLVATGIIGLLASTFGA